MGFLEDLKYVELGKQAAEAAKIQQAQQQGASTYAQWLAKLAAEQAYMNQVAPTSSVGRPTNVLTESDLNQPVNVGGRTFAPAPSGLAAQQLK